MIKELITFLKEYKIFALAIAFIMGVAANTLIKSLVDNVIMPIISPFIQGGAWETATFTIWKIVISWGAFLSDLIYFIIVAFVIYIIAKKLLKQEKVEKI